MSPAKKPDYEFDLSHHGDEVIVSTEDDGNITMRIKIQTAKSEHRAILLTFQTQSQCERLLPAILKGLQNK